MKQPIITIGRECGSGGRHIARKLAEALSVPFYDKKLIEMAAKDTGLSEEYIQKAEEQTSSFLYNLYFSSQNLPISDQVFVAQAAVIRRVAEKGPCVIVGRCADYVLREREDCMHIFIHAPLEQRMARAITEYDVKEADARTFILRQDKRRASYYNHFTTSRWGDCHGYHLTINTALGEENVLRVLLDAVQGVAQ